MEILLDMKTHSTGGKGRESKLMTMIPFFAFTSKMIGGSTFAFSAKSVERDFSRALRNEPVDWKKVGIDGIILEVAYSDDYEQWLHKAVWGGG